MTAEEWRAVPGFPGYFISSIGRVASERGPGSNRRLRVPTLGKRGYLTVGMEVGGGRHLTKHVHSLVLLAFVGPRPTGLMCRHLNGVRTDNRLENLRWGTGSENQIDRVDHGQHHYAVRDACKHGHPFTPQNTRMEPRPNGRFARRCRECSNKWSREAKRSRRAKAGAAA